MLLSRRQSLLLLAAGLAPQLNLRAAVAPISDPLSAEERAFHALNRLGFGPTPADAAAIRRLGAAAWLEQFLELQLNSALAGGPVLPASLQSELQDLDTLRLTQTELLARFREAQRLARAEKQNAPKAEASMAAQAQPSKARQELIRPVVQQASAQRLLRALHSPTQLEEVLVDFWFNHFNVYSAKGPVSVLVGNYEQEAIRPFVWGRFRDMLGATAKHPAMLIYLDNVLSVAPGYQAQHRFDVQQVKATGLNENYARELMELHTLGVDGGYSQRDVIELARILTGWTVAQGARRGSLRPGGAFEFDLKRHDRGDKQWLGRTVAGGGQSEGELALDVLAAHPATARHIAFKLAQAFVADQPPVSLVQTLAERFLATRGDLRALVQTLVSSEDFWRRESLGAKFKTPYQYLLSSLRAVDAQPVGMQPVEMQPLLGSLAQAGMPLYGAQTPDGYKNTRAAWLNPEALAQRVQLASKLAERIERQGRGNKHRSRSAELMETLGATLHDSTRKAVAQEPSDLQVALLLGSPDFMRR